MTSRLDSKLKKKNFLILHTFWKDNNIVAHKDTSLISYTKITLGVSFYCKVNIPRNIWHVNQISVSCHPTCTCSKEITEELVFLLIATYAVLLCHARSIMTLLETSRPGMITFQIFFTCSLCMYKWGLLPFWVCCHKNMCVRICMCTSHKGATIRYIGGGLGRSGD